MSACLAGQARGAPSSTDREFLLACQEGLLCRVKESIESGADINTTNEDDRSGLMLAVLLQYTDIIEYLLETKANLYLKDRGGDSALMMAVKTESLSIVSLLVAASKNKNALSCSDKYRRTPLIVAAMKQNMEMIAYILKSGKTDDINAKDKDGNTALLTAIAHYLGGPFKLIELLAQRSDIEAANKRGYTALILAAKLGHLKIVEYLVDIKKADKERTSESGCSAVIMAARYGHLDVVKYLTDENAKLTTESNKLIDNSTNGRIVAHTIAATDPLRKSPQAATLFQPGKSALLYAVKNCHNAIVEFLLSISADIRVKDENGNSAIYHAANSGNVTAVKMLIDRMRQDDKEIDKALAVSEHLEVKTILWAKKYKMNIEFVRWVVDRLRKFWEPVPNMEVPDVLCLSILSREHVFTMTDFQAIDALDDLLKGDQSVLVERIKTLHRAACSEPQRVPPDQQTPSTDSQTAPGPDVASGSSAQGGFSAPGATEFKAGSDSGCHWTTGPDVAAGSSAQGGFSAPGATECKAGSDSGCHWTTGPDVASGSSAQGGFSAPCATEFKASSDSGCHWTTGLDVAAGASAQGGFSAPGSGSSGDFLDRINFNEACPVGKTQGGSSSGIMLVHDKFDRSEIYAIKLIKLEADEESMNREISILSKIKEFQDSEGHASSRSHVIEFKRSLSRGECSRYLNAEVRGGIICSWGNMGTLRSCFDGELGPFLKRNALVVVLLLHQVAEGVRWLHGQHIVHLDIKEDNIVVERRMYTDGYGTKCSRLRAMLIDFDRAMDVCTDEAVGSVAYLRENYADSIPGTEHYHDNSYHFKQFVVNADVDVKDSVQYLKFMDAFSFSKMMMSCFDGKLYADLSEECLQLVKGSKVSFSERVFPRPENVECDPRVVAYATFLDLERVAAYIQLGDLRPKKSGPKRDIFLNITERLMGLINAEDKVLKEIKERYSSLVHFYTLPSSRSDLMDINVYV